MGRIVKINGEPYHAEIRRYDGGFNWQFWVPINNGKQNGDHKKITLKFSRFWLGYLARDLGSVLQEEHNELARIKTLVENGVSVKE